MISLPFKICAPPASTSGMIVAAPMKICAPPHSCAVFSSWTMLV